MKQFFLDDLALIAALEFFLQLGPFEAADTVTRNQDNRVNTIRHQSWHPNISRPAFPIGSFPPYFARWSYLFAIWIRCRLLIRHVAFICNKLGKLQELNQ